MATAPVWSRPLLALVAAHALFALGIVPHTLYWVDYIARDLGLGLAVGGLHWSLVGVFSFFGPWLLAGLAWLIGTAPALVAGFLLLAGGIAWPALWPIAAVLAFSSAAFGMQPGLSSLLAARTRDLSTAAAMPRVMRAMILASSASSAVGGLVVPMLFEHAGGHAPVLLLGGAAMLAGAVLALPFGRRRLAA